MKFNHSLAFAITAIRRPVWGIRQESRDIATTHQEKETL